MKRSDTILYLLLSIIVSCILLYVIRSRNRIEGFDDASLQTDYTTLQARLKSTMADYCDLATYVQKQMKIIYTATKPAEAGPTDTEAQAIAHIRQTYMDVYACKDSGASSRQTCSSTGTGSNTSFIPCIAYTLPNWDGTSDTTNAIALSAIPDDLPDRVAKELDWYSQIITKLQHALDLGASPPTSVPDPMPDHFDEGFVDKCSAAQAQAQVAQAAQAQEADKAESCTMPSIDAEIVRVNAILDSSILTAALAKCTSLKTSMVKLQSDQQKAADGTLYDWQKPPPKKSYKSYPTGNRKDSLVSSIQQNR